MVIIIIIIIIIIGELSLYKYDDDDVDEVKDLLLWILKNRKTRNFKRNLYYKWNVLIT